MESQERAKTRNIYKSLERTLTKSDQSEKDLIAHIKEVKKSINISAEKERERSLQRSEQLDLDKTIVSKTDSQDGDDLIFPTEVDTK